MVTNLAFVDGHPVIREGADDGELTLVDGRVRVSSAAHRAVAFTLERSIDGGVTWETVLAESVPGNGANLVDYESLSYGTTLYRAVAFTVEGATSETTVEVVADSEALWLSGGPAYGDTGRLPLNPEARHAGGRQRALKQYAGRSKPVAVSGEALSRVVQVSGRVTDETWVEETANVEDLIRIAQLPDRLFLFRDPDGRRIYGVIGNADLDRLQAIDKTDVGWNGLWGYSFTFTEAT